MAGPADLVGVPMNVRDLERVAAVLGDVGEERYRQYLKWGEQNHPDGTGFDDWAYHRDLAQLECRTASDDGDVTWAHILLEEVYEALAEDNAQALRAELVQVAAVAVQWIELLDRRSQSPAAPTSTPGAAGSSSP